jgi:hypothetical protein
MLLKQLDGVALLEHLDIAAPPSQEELSTALSAKWA